MGSGNSINNVVNAVKNHYKKEDIDREINEFIHDLIKNDLVEKIS